MARRSPARQATTGAGEGPTSERAGSLVAASTQLHGPHLSDILVPVPASGIPFRPASCARAAQSLRGALPVVALAGIDLEVSPGEFLINRGSFWRRQVNFST
jgi:hypothetical protein